MEENQKMEVEKDTFRWEDYYDNDDPVVTPKVRQIYDELRKEPESMPLAPENVEELSYMFGDMKIDVDPIEKKKLKKLMSQKAHQERQTMYETLMLENENRLANIHDEEDLKKLEKKGVKLFRPIKRDENIDPMTIDSPNLIYQIKYNDIPKELMDSLNGIFPISRTVIQDLNIKNMFFFYEILYQLPIIDLPVNVSLLNLLIFSQTSLKVKSSFDVIYEYMLVLDYLPINIMVRTKTNFIRSWIKERFQTGTFTTLIAEYFIAACVHKDNKTVEIFYKNLFTVPTNTEQNEKEPYGVNLQELTLFLNNVVETIHYEKFLPVIETYEKNQNNRELPHFYEDFIDYSYEKKKKMHELFFESFDKLMEKPIENIIGDEIRTLLYDYTFQLIEIYELTIYLILSKCTYEPNESMSQNKDLHPIINYIGDLKTKKEIPKPENVNPNILSLILNKRRKCNEARMNFALSNMNNTEILENLKNEQVYGSDEELRFLLFFLQYNKSREQYFEDMKNLENHLKQDRLNTLAQNYSTVDEPLPPLINEVESLPDDPSYFPYTETREMSKEPYNGSFWNSEGGWSTNTQKELLPEMIDPEKITERTYTLLKRWVLKLEQVQKSFATDMVFRKISRRIKIKSYGVNPKKCLYCETMFKPEIYTCKADKVMWHNNVLHCVDNHFVLPSKTFYDWILNFQL